jgi:hypothetical protein
VGKIVAGVVGEGVGVAFGVAEGVGVDAGDGQLWVEGDGPGEAA